MSATEAPLATGNGHVGRSLRRKEDPRLIQGQASYVDDMNLTGQVWAAWVRSPEAHAKIVSIDTSAAKERDGVIAVYTNEDLDMEAGLPMAWVPPGVDVNTPDHWVLAKGEVKHVGDPVALVIGEDRYGVVDAAEDVFVEYDPLPVVTDPEAALEDGSPLVHEQFGTNKVCEWSLGGGDLEAGFAEADHIIERRVVNHRIAGAAIEPRAVLADFHADRLTVYSSTQVPHFLRLFLSIILGISEDRVRAVAPEVGGAFGSKLQIYARGDRLRVGVAQAGAPGEVGRDALRGDDGHPPRARPDRQGQGRLQERRHDDRVPRDDHRRPGRLPDAAHTDDPAAERVRHVRRVYKTRRADRRHRRS